MRVRGPDASEELRDSVVSSTPDSTVDIGKTAGLAGSTRLQELETRHCVGDSTERNAPVCEPYRLARHSSRSDEYGRRRR